MEEKRIDFETARLAKKIEFGYDFKGTHYVSGFYCEEGDNGYLDFETLHEFEMQQEDACRCDYYLRPTQSLLQKYLREVYKIEICIRWYGREITPKYELEVDEVSDTFGNSKYVKNNTTLDGFKTYEEALENGLQKAIGFILLSEYAMKIL